MAARFDPSSSSRARSSPRPPEHANTFDPVAIKAPFAGQQRPAAPFPASRDAEEGSRRRGHSFIGAAASPATLRVEAERRSLENLSARGATEQTESASSAETVVEQRQVYPAGGSGGRPRGPRTLTSDRGDQPSRLRGEPTKEGGGSIGGEQAMEEGMGGGDSGRHGGRIRPRRVFTRADPKSYFSNERTMYSWMYFNLLTLSYSLSLYAYPHFAGENPATDVAATFGSAAALVLVACSALRFGLRQERLAGNQSWMTWLARPRLLRRSNTVAVREDGGELVRQADVFDDGVLGYPLLVTVLVIAVLVSNVVCIYRTPVFKVHRSRAFTA